MRYAIPKLPPPQWDSFRDEYDDLVQLRSETYAPVHIGRNYFVQAHYLRILRHAGITTLRLPDERYDEKFDKHPLYFCGDNFEGVVMCCEPVSE